MGSDVVAHLVWQDVKRNLRPIRALPPLFLAWAIAYDRFKFHNRIGTEQDFLYFAEGALSHHPYWLVTLVPIFAGVMSGSLAVERRMGITSSILSRGVSRRAYLVSKLLAAGASSAILTFGAILGFWAIIFTIWIPGRPRDLDPQWIEGPAKALFLYSPFLHDLLVALMEMIGAAGLSVIGVLAGLIVANEYVAMAATPITLILVTVIMRQVSDVLNPEEYLSLGYDFYWGPHFRGLIPFAPFLYWGTFAMVIYFVCQRIFAKKEIA